jgi:hypothetical protein
LDADLSRTLRPERIEPPNDNPRELATKRWALTEQAGVPDGRGAAMQRRPTHHDPTSEGGDKRNGEEDGQGREEEGRQEAVSCLTR